MSLHPLRLLPGQELRSALIDHLRPHGLEAAFVLAGIGSLNSVAIRFAGRDGAARIDGPLEILTLSGTLSPEGAHLHISVADREGRIIGGHLDAGSIVRTTAEILLAPLEGVIFSRRPDARTGFNELVIEPKG